jgi:hypothetical protein
MLLNAFLNQHRNIEEQGRKIQEQPAAMSGVKSIASKQEATIADLKINGHPAAETNGQT